MGYTRNLELLSHVGIGTTSIEGSGSLQLLSGTTKAAGVALGTDTFIYRARPDSVVMPSDVEVGLSSEGPSIELGGKSASTDGSAYIDFHTAGGSIDYNFRVLRASGSNGLSYICNTGTGSLIVNVGGTASLLSHTGGMDALTIDCAGNIGIGQSIPSAKLHIGGTSGVDGIKFPDGTLQTTAMTSASVSTYTSADRTIIVGGIVTVAHGLGIVPKIWQATIRCITAEFEYVSGDELFASFQGGDGLSLGVAGVNSTNFFFTCYQTGIRLVNKSGVGGTVNTATPANWALVFRAVIF